MSDLCRLDLCETTWGQGNSFCELYSHGVPDPSGSPDTSSPLTLPELPLMSGCWYSVSIPIGFSMESLWSLWWWFGKPHNRLQAGQTVGQNICDWVGVPNDSFDTSSGYRSWLSQDLCPYCLESFLGLLSLIPWSFYCARFSPHPWNDPNFWPFFPVFCLSPLDFPCSHPNTNSPAKSILFTLLNEILASL